MQNIILCFHDDNSYLGWHSNVAKLMGLFIRKKKNGRYRKVTKKGIKDLRKRLKKGK